MRARIFMVMRIVGGICLVAYLSLLYYVASYTSPETPAPAEAAIVLGAQSFRYGAYNPCLVSRVAGAVSLYHDRTVREIIVSGGDDVNDHSNEAHTMAIIAQKQNVPAKDIIQEPKSTSTYENLLFSKALMHANQINSVIVVSEPFHIARARLVARTLGVKAQYRAVDSQCWRRWKYISWSFLREPAAILYYMARKRITIDAF